MFKERKNNITKQGVRQQVMTALGRIAPVEVWNRTTLADGDLFAAEFNRIYTIFTNYFSDQAEKEIGRIIMSTSPITDSDFTDDWGGLLDNAEYPIATAALAGMYDEIQYIDAFNTDLNIDLKSADVPIGKTRIPYLRGLSPVCINETTSGFNKNTLANSINGDRTRPITGNIPNQISYRTDGTVTGAFTEVYFAPGYLTNSVSSGHSKNYGIDSARVVPTGTHGSTPAFVTYMYLRIAYTVPGVITIK